MMEELKLRGYVSPEDFDGTPADKIQKALDLAEKEDIRKVVIEGGYLVDRTVFIPSQTEIILKKDAFLVRTGEGPLFMNRVASEKGKNSWSFEDKRIYLKGEENAEIKGDLSFYHAKYVVLEDLRIAGTVCFEFCREVRMERDEITGKENAVVLERGCNNFIMQYLKLHAEDTALVLDTRLQSGPYVIGKDEEIHEIIFRDSQLNAPTGVKLGASEEFGLFNIQIDHHKCSGKGIVIGDGLGLPEKRFFNITATDLAAEGEERIMRNEVRHCFFGN
jgi:hypothetical protein